jgi:hypothetical protein
VRPVLLRVLDSEVRLALSPKHRSSGDPLAGPTIRGRLVQVAAPSSGGANEPHALSGWIPYGRRIALVPVVVVVARPFDSLSCVNVDDANAAVGANDDPVLVHEADRDNAADGNGNSVPLHAATVARWASRPRQIPADIAGRSTGAMRVSDLTQVSASAAYRVRCT